MTLEEAMNIILYAALGHYYEYGMSIKSEEAIKVINAYLTSKGVKPNEIT